MKTPSRKAPCSLVLATLLFLPAMPAGAASPGGFDLHLEEALTLQGSDFLLGGTSDVGSDSDERSDSGEGLSSRLDSPEDAEPAPQLRPRSLEEVAAQVRRKGEEDPGRQPNAGGFGRWIKKRWYVPVIAAIAIGVVVADSDDNDASGEED